MIIKLDGHSLTAADRFQAEKLQLQLSERQSTATMTLAEGAPALSVGDWLQIEHGPGAGIVWRVRTIDTQADKRTRTVTLEHGINTLKDLIMFGKVTTKMISGGDTATAQQTINYILANQSDWTLGTFSYASVSNPYHFNGDDLFSALETVSSSLEDCIWSYDFSSYPFTISITQKDSTVGSEMRSDRNIRTLKKTVDRSRMYTRIYPIGKNNLQLDAKYLSKNENLYGIVSKVETDESIETKAELQAWAQERLNRHCEPNVSVTISGLDLSEATGEPLDSFTIGKICRVPLPEFSTTITERVCKLSYSDVISAPEEVTITLANELTDVAKILREQSASSGRGGRAKAANDEEDHAWFVDTTDHVAMVAEAVGGKDGDEPNWSRVAELTVDGNGIDARVTHAEGDIVDAFAAIQVTDQKITTEVNAASSTLRTFVMQTASNILTQLDDTENGLYNYTNETAGGLVTRMISTTNRTWVQEDDPTTEAGGSFEPKTGDVWIQSTHQGTWDGADGFDWQHDENFNWFDIQGAKTYAWANDKWELVNDQQQVVTYTDVVDTAELLLRQKIAGIVNDEGMIDIYMSKLEQTVTEINAEVSAANSALYSYIHMTASNINIGVGNRPTTVRQTAQPTTINNRGLKENDIWIETQYQEDWDAALNFNWEDDTEIEWNKLRNDVIHVYDGTKWVTAEDNTVLAEDTDIQVQQDHIALLARNIATVDGYAKENFSALRVEAARISSLVQNKTDNLYSKITQTATEIRAEVVDVNNGLSSTISQTASQIRAEVSNSVSELQSSITVQANKIALVVEGTGNNAHIKPASIVAAINNGASSVIISADHINLDGYVQASDFEAMDLLVYKIGATYADLTHLNAYDIVFSNKLRFSTGTGYYDLSNPITTASVSNNTLTLKHADGSTAATFSKATTLSGAWSSGKLTVTASPQNVKYERLLGQGTPSWNGKTVSIPINAQWGDSGQYSESTGWSASVNTSSKLQSKTYTSNGTRYPDSGYIGFSSVTVNVPTYSKSANIKCTGKSSSGGLTKYTFEYETTNSSQFSSGTTYNMHYN